MTPPGFQKINLLIHVPMFENFLPTKWTQTGMQTEASSVTRPSTAQAFHANFFWTKCTHDPPRPLAPHLLQLSPSHTDSLLLFPHPISLLSPVDITRMLPCIFISPPPSRLSCTDPAAHTPQLFWQSKFLLLIGIRQITLNTQPLAFFPQKGLCQICHPTPQCCEDCGRELPVGNTTTAGDKTYPSSGESISPKKSDPGECTNSSIACKKKQGQKNPNPGNRLLLFSLPDLIRIKILA